MHDLVRDMAIKVASVIPHRFLVKAGMQLEDIPNEEMWSEDLVRVSLRKFFKSDDNLMLRGEEIGSWKSKKLSTGDLRTSMTLSLVSDDGKRDNPTTTAFFVGYGDIEETLSHRNVNLSKVVGTEGTLVLPRGIQSVIYLMIAMV
ncbi:hypothetical protein L484_003022 [Morus notabilis]|uniref:Uncharacterized protein n=1 Tax=Morus notabilis TaxID=981085 RepID=W9R210_9ROSA|nr:hypothetical protein L484_003022 [Morus notabilis]